MVVVGGGDDDGDCGSDFEGIGPGFSANSFFYYSNHQPRNKAMCLLYTST